MTAAEEYAKTRNWVMPTIQEPTAKQAYIAGAKEYYEKLAEAQKQIKLLTESLNEVCAYNRWHLVKDGDYPKEECQVLTYSLEGYQTLTLMSDPAPIFKHYKVIAWCELPLPPMEVEE